MISTRRVIILAFILATIVSVSSISYNVYLIFGAYDVGRLLNVSISNINVTRLGDEASLEIYFLLDNPTRFTLRLVYVAAFVYLNGQALTLSNAPATLIRYSNPIQLPPFSAVPVPIGLGNIPSHKVPTNSSNHWTMEVQLVIYGVPLTGVGYPAFNLEFMEAGS